MKKHLILGPPGTGKTTHMLSLVENCLARGIPPNRIAFMTFTKSGAKEARDRACKRFDLKEKQLPYFKTLHAMCYRETGARKVMGYRDYRELSNTLGYNVTGREDMNKGYTRGQVIRHVEEQSRNRCIPLREASALLSPEINPYQIEHYQQSLMEQKRVSGVPDYTDMLESFVKRNCPLDVDVMIIDEAQDLTELQWRVVEVAQRQANVVYYAGDDDQTVHVWAGASIERFMELGTLCNDKMVLDHSYRLPRAVHKFACRLADRIGDRYEKHWTPRDAEGSVKYANSPMQLPLKEGDWMMLSRNNALLEEYEEALQHQGFFYQVNDVMFLGDVIKNIRIWEAMRKGTPQTYRDLAVLYTKCLMKGNFEGKAGNKYLLTDLSLPDVPWFEAFERIPIAHRNYIQSCMRNGEKPDNPRINLMSIHASKGRECQNVVLMSDCSKACADEQYKEPDSEHRVFFVGASRAKENLFIINATQENYYPL